MTREPGTRGRYEGLLNVVRFNWPMLSFGLGAGIVACVAAKVLCGPRWLKTLLGLGGSAALVQTGVSLGVTHAVYDRSRLYRWDWIHALLPSTPKRIANIHSGFDESSEALRRLFPDAELNVLDFYHPREQTEPSIARARALYPPSAATVSVRIDSLPLPDASQDLVLFFLAAHEVRTPQQRAVFLREAARTLAPTGRLLIVEHLRDLPNFLAYGPGALHFHSRSEWARAIRSAPLSLVKEISITSFIRVFSCCRSS